ncbi:cation acetate symporter [Pseudonocardia sp. CA-107938]|uniref:sodium/solute symporter n=1 Tax=Pseudonocardia sp. CA-107938 TaxID=3240021 RepID=UPI003D8E08C4
MTTSEIVPLVAIALVALISAMIGFLGVRVTRSTSDFLVASRTVKPLTNASAISGEYLSAASFLGIGGVIIATGADGLWYPVSFVVGYLALQLFVAAPLRRSGAYTVPDFAEARLSSPRLRQFCALTVLLIGWLYLLAQMQGAGMALTALTSLPTWVGVVATGVVVLLTVLGGGMRSITFVQAFQFWIKVAAVAVPLAALFSLFLSSGAPRPAGPVFETETTVTVHAGVGLNFASPVNIDAYGVVDGVRVDGPHNMVRGVHDIDNGTRLVFPAGAAVPEPVGMTPDESWLDPSAGPLRLLEIYSIMVAGFFGTMGLPHVLVRFYTNEDGRAARRTTVLVLLMIGTFYLLITLLSYMSRHLVPQVLLQSRADAAVLLVPTAAFGDSAVGWGLAGLVAAGTAAAFLATSSGLVVSLAGVLFTDVLPGRVRNFRLATALATVVPLSVGLTTTRLEFNLLVPLAFAVAASTFCPLLILGIWWRGLTAAGATTGVAVGGLLSGAASIASLYVPVPDNWIGVLANRPALVTAPLAFAVTVVVSKLTRANRPSDVDAVLLQLHAPERLGLGVDRLTHQRTDGPELS